MNYLQKHIDYINKFNLYTVVHLNSREYFIILGNKVSPECKNNYIGENRLGKITIINLNNYNIYSSTEYNNIYVPQIKYKYTNNNTYCIINGNISILTSLSYIENINSITVLDFSELNTRNIKINSLAYISNLNAIILPHNLLTFEISEYPKNSPFLIFSNNQSEIVFNTINSQNNFYVYTTASNEQYINNILSQDIQIYNINLVAEYVKSIYPLVDSTDINTLCKLFMQMDTFLLDISMVPCVINQSWFPYKLSANTYCNDRYITTHPTIKNPIVKYNEIFSLELDSYEPFKTVSMVVLNKYTPFKMSNYPYKNGFISNSYIEISSMFLDSYAYLAIGTGIFYPLGITLIGKNKLDILYKLWLKKPSNLINDYEAFTDYIKTLGWTYNNFTDKILNKSYTLSEILQYGNMKYEWEITKKIITADNLEYKNYNELSSATLGTINFICDRVNNLDMKLDATIYNLAKIYKYDTVQMWREPEPSLTWRYEIFTTRVEKGPTNTKGIGHSAGLFNCVPQTSNCIICLSGEQYNYDRWANAAKCSKQPLNLYSKTIQ